MAFIPTNASQVQQFAGALYGITVGTTTMAQVTADIAALGSLNAALNAYYGVSFGATATSVVANTIVTNLGITGDAATAAKAYVQGRLDATAAGNRGAVVGEMLNQFLALTADATFGAAATAWTTKVEGSINYAGASNIPVGTVVTSGQTFTLLVTQDTVVGTPGNDTVRGIFGGATGDTVTAGDSVDGGAGTGDVLDLTVQGATASPAAVVVKNVETISIKDLVGGTFNALLVENTPTISYVGTTSGVTSTVTSAALGSTLGLSGAGNLTVDYLTTTGTADTAKVSLAGAGTSTTARSTVNVSDSNSIEAVSIDTSGTNFVTLTAGSAAKSVTVTGAGTNNIDVSAAGAVSGVLTIDASATTGANTFVMGDTLNSIDVVKGGSSASDSVSANLVLATLNKPTMTGIETLTLDFDAAGTYDLTGTTGLTTVTLSGSTADNKIVKAAAEVATLNVTSQADADNDITFSRATGAKAALTLNIGSTASTAANITLDDVSLSGTTALTLNTVGTKVYDFNGGDFAVAGDQSAITVTVGATADLEHSYMDVTGEVGAYSVTVGADATYSGGVYANDNAIGDITVSVADGGFAQVYAETDDGGLGNISMTGTGGEFNGVFYASGLGGAGDVDLTVNGSSGNYFGLIVSGGDIGDIALSVTNGSLGVYVSGTSYSHDAADYADDQGNIGNITIEAGDDAYISANFATSRGDIGDITVTSTGDNVYVNLDVSAGAVSGQLDSDADYEYIRGGSIGDISIQMTGDDATFSGAIHASGGNVGSITANIGDGGYAYFGIATTVTYMYASGGIGGNVGEIDITVGDNTDLDVYLTFDREAAGITVVGGSDMSAGIYISGGGYASAGYTSLGDSSVTLGDDGEIEFVVSGFSGNVGNVTLTVGRDAEASGYFDNIDGDVGDVSSTIGLNSSTELEFYDIDGTIGSITVAAADNTNVDVYLSGNDSDVGAISLTGGDESDVYLDVESQSGGSAMESISITVGDDASGYVNLDGVSGAVGLVTMTGGASSDLDFVFSGGNNDGLTGVNFVGGNAASTATVDMNNAGTIDTFGGIDASAWLGSLTANISSVATGTTVRVGAGGSTVTGGQSSDDFFLGAGADTVVFNDTTTDSVFSFSGTADKINVAFFGGSGTETAVAANATAIDDDVTDIDDDAFVFANGADGAGAEAIASYSDLADVYAFIAAQFSNADATDNIVAVINDVSTKIAYVYAVADVTDSATISLVGVVNSTAVLTTTNVVN